MEVPPRAAPANRWPLVATISSMALLLPTGFAAAQAVLDRARADTEGVYHLPAFSVPPSQLASPEARAAAVEVARRVAAMPVTENPLNTSSLRKILEIRTAADAGRKRIVEEMRKTYAVTLEQQTIGGVPVDVVTPTAGVSSRNRNRVLINLHGGGMIFGSRYEGLVASIPIAATARMKVITVDYRMAPEHSFPAASEDVAKVYAQILKAYRPTEVGIYGCSAGAALTAQSVAWFLAHGLPVPGAISLDGGGAVWSPGGDSAYLAGGFMSGIPRYPESKSTSPAALEVYWGDADTRQALISPALHDGVIRRFPPTLVLNSTRDTALSSAVFTHSRLVATGARAELHVWEGVQHCFSYDPSLPESREAYAVVSDFFDRHLSTARETRHRVVPR